MADKNQDKNQSKNRAEQAEEHDESVLNPEIKNESDLSKKERRLIEKEKLKGMGPKKKLEYIWMYYKPAIFGVVPPSAAGARFHLFVHRPRSGHGALPLRPRGRHASRPSGGAGPHGRAVRPAPACLHPGPAFGHARAGSPVRATQGDPALS